MTTRDNNMTLNRCQMSHMVPVFRFILVLRGHSRK